jgi:1,4-dihydroxy-2-naphthoyl-CoA synthase
VSQDVGSADGAVTARRDGTNLRLTLDRPATRSSLSHSTVDALVGALTSAAADDELSCRTTNFQDGLAALREHRTPEFHGR